MAKKDYVPFIINRGLGYFPDTVLYANEMNRNSSIPVDWQFSFLLNSISKKKRFSKWHKKDQNSDDLSLVMKAYGYSSQKAVQALEILTDDQMQSLRNTYSLGGR